MQFVTSDQPVRAFDRNAQALGPKRYRPTTAMEMWFPVSPKYILSGDFREGAPKHVVVSPKIVATCNRNQMRKAPKDIYAAYRSEELKAEFDRIVDERGSLIPELPREMID